MSNPNENLLLRSLAVDDRLRLMPNLQPVSLSLGQVICEPGRSLLSGYLPTSGVVSLVYTTEDGATAEMAIVGNDGIVGASIVLGGQCTWGQAVVAVAGEGYKIPAASLLHEFNGCVAWRSIILRYVQALLTQVAQTAVCNRLHSVEQRLCRWLLLCHDRTESSEFLMTQELIAHMLGGRRESVTVAAGHLQDLGLIHYCRGHITIIDRGRLAASACECYRVVEEEYVRLFGRRHDRQVSRMSVAIEEAGTGKF